MRPRVLSAIAAGAWLCACGAGQDEPYVRQYTLLGGSGGGASPLAAEAGSPGGVLRVAAVSAPGWLRSQRIYYRLGYTSANEVGSYAYARWVAPPPQMLHTLVTSAADRDGGWKAVIGSGDPSVAGATLHVELVELLHEFETPERSRGALRARATLVDERTQEVIAQRDLDYREEAASPDAAGGVRAMRRASHAFAEDVGAWAWESAASSGLRAPEPASRAD